MKNDNKNLTYSCEDLQGSVYFAPNVLRHCCQRFFVNKKMHGDVEIMSVKNDNDISVEKIIEEKKKIIYNLNNNKSTPCDHCPKIQKKNWTKKIKIKKISVESHSKCNARCSYCSDMFYGGLNPNYKVEECLKKFRKNKFFENKVSITWGGGEPVLLKNFNKIFETFMKSQYPKFNDVRVYSNSIIYNRTIHKYINKREIIFTTSTDAGTQKTFEIVRGVKKGFLNIFKNLQKYNDKKLGNIIIKYILTDENCKKNELISFANLIKEYDLLNCNFEISSDYKFENLDLKKAYSLIFFYNKLKNMGAKHVHFDDHVRKRLFKTLKSDVNLKDIETSDLFKHLKKYFDKEIIIWGTGNYAYETVRNSFLFKKSKIACFINDNKDENLKQKDFFNKEVHRPDYLITSDKPIFIASSTYWHQIYSKIIKLGVNKKRVINSLVL